FHLVADEFATAAQACDQVDAARHTLDQAYEQAPGLELLGALAKLDGTDLAHSPALLGHLQQQPSLSAAQAVLAKPVAEWDEAAATAVRAAVAKAARPLQRYRCAACGFEGQRYFWQCPGCLGWDSFPTRKIEDL
ncbi:MAG: hypothetical protein KA185_15190, partial [Vitreoscilla sp.]|nr:hypothetical protein [Vitreoscilla sp.]